MKQELRSSFLEKRRELDKKSVEEKGRWIAKTVLALNILKTAKAVASYADFDNEVPTHNIIKGALEMGKVVGVPRMLVENQTLSFHAIQSLQELTPNKQGILEPPATNQELKPVEIELVLVPGIAFDEGGYRLGFGKGYFDKALKELVNATKGGLAFEAFVVPKLPVEEHDVRLDFLVTEKQVRHFSKNP